MKGCVLYVGVGTLLKQNLQIELKCKLSKYNGCYLFIFPANDALKWAAKEGNVQGIKAALEQGADLECRNTSGEGRTPLMVACVGGNIYAVDYLLLCGAQVNSLDCRNRTPLHLAAWYGHEDIVQLLLEHGAKFNAVASFPWQTANVYARVSRHSQVVTVLEEWKKKVKEEKKAAAKDKKEKKAAAKAREAKSPGLMGKFKSAFTK